MIFRRVDDGAIWGPDLERREEGVVVALMEWERVRAGDEIHNEPHTVAEMVRRLVKEQNSALRDFHDDAFRSE